MKGNALLHLFKVSLGIDKPHSQTTELEKRAIAKYAKGSKVAVEIGVYEGVNTVNIAQNLDQDGKLYAIDPFWRGSLGIAYGKLIALNLVRKYKLAKRIQFIEKLSFDAKDEVPNNIDFIFVDGDHSYEGIKKDWKDWSNKVRVGGFIALHDTSVPKHDPSVVNLGSYKFFQDSIKNDYQFEIIETVDSLNILKKAKK